MSEKKFYRASVKKRVFNNYEDETIDIKPKKREYFYNWAYSIKQSEKLFRDEHGWYDRQIDYQGDLGPTYQQYILTIEEDTYTPPNRDVEQLSIFDIDDDDEDW